MKKITLATALVAAILTCSVFTHQPSVSSGLIGFCGLVLSGVLLYHILQPRNA